MSEFLQTIYLSHIILTSLGVVVDKAFFVIMPSLGTYKCCKKQLCANAPHAEYRDVVDNDVSSTTLVAVAIQHEIRHENCLSS